LDSEDVQIFPSTNPQNEIHISINKNNPSIIVASANSGTYHQGRYISNDGGNTWFGSDDLISGTLVNGDPSTAFDIAGNIYISTVLYTPTLQPKGYGILKSTNNGASWGSLIQVNTSAFVDKEMIAIDTYSSSPYKNNLYCVWTDNISTTPTVYFNRSVDGGSTFSSPIALYNGSWGKGPSIQTGLNGEVYVCLANYASTSNNYSRGFSFTKSLDGGVTFSQPQLTPIVNYTGVMSVLPTSNFNNVRVNDFPVIAVDKSCGTHKGRIYAVFCAQQNGNGKAIVEICFSDDKGDSWSTPQEISISNGSQSFFPWISVDDFTGNVYVAYYSFDTSTAYETNTYVAFSQDGVSFTNQKISDVSHITQPIHNNFCGDYIGIAAYGGRAYAAWMDNRNGTWQAYVSAISNNYVKTSTANPICSQANYSVGNLTSGTVTWPPPSPNVFSFTPDPINPNATIATRTNNSYSGNVSVSAIINGACGQASVTPLNVWVGNPGADNSTLIYPAGQRGVNPVTLTVGGLYRFICDPVSYASSYTWILPTGFSFYSGSTSSSPWITTSLTAGSYTLYCRANNICGFAYTHSLGINISTGGGGGGAAAVVASYPNPTNSDLYVEIVDSTSMTSLQIPFTVNVLNKQSQSIFIESSNGGKIQIPVSSLKPDIYYLIVHFKDAIIRRQIFVSH
jgi:hypothetical protein